MKFILSLLNNLIKMELVKIENKNILKDIFFT